MSSRSLHQVDAIVAGGGLAGIHLALAMDRAGMRAIVVDHPNPTSSSRIAAGVINPITGRRFALSWMYDRLKPVFTQVYEYWEQQWGVRFFYPKNIFRSVPQNKLVNDLDAKLSDPAFDVYCRRMTQKEIEVAREAIHFDGPGYVMHGYQLDTVRFLETAIAYLKSKSQYVAGQIEGSARELAMMNFRFGDFQSDKMIWANGASIVHHPAFEWVRMNPNKGEILIADVPTYAGKAIIKQSAFYIPLGNHKWWIGTFDTWELDDNPSAKGRQYLLSRATLLQHPYTEVDHLAGIRPAVEDRRPILGAHPQNEHLFLFNGFGSKGTSLIPYFAQMLVEHMVNGTDIHPEADVKRFW